MPFVLASDQSTPTNVAIDDTHLYWTNQVPEGAVMRVGLLGGPPEEVAAFEFEPGGLFVDGTHIYWSEFGSPGSVRRLAKADSGDSAKAEELAKDQPKSLSVTVDANNVYFTTSQTIRSVSKSGGAVKEIASNQNYPAVLITSYGFLYWTSTFGGFVAQADTYNLDAGVQLLASNQSSPGGLTVDLGNLYWANYLGDSSGGTPRIMTVDRTGATAPVVLADGQAGPTMVAQFGTHVYWTNNVGGTVMRVPKTGGLVEELASGQQAPAGLAVDTTAIYWVNRDDGMVMALAR